MSVIERQSWGLGEILWWGDEKTFQSADFGEIDRFLDGEIEI